MVLSSSDDSLPVLNSLDSIYTVFLRDISSTRYIITILITPRVNKEELLLTYPNNILTNGRLEEITKFFVDGAGSSIPIN